MNQPTEKDLEEMLAKADRTVEGFLAEQRAQVEAEIERLARAVGVMIDDE